MNTTVWGAKMAFDVGDTREKFDERIQTEQDRMNEMGMSTYLGQQGAMILGGVALNRVGVKKTPNLKPDSGGDGGKGQGVEGKGNINPNGTPNPTHNAKGERIDNVDVPKVKFTSVTEYMRQEDAAINMYTSSV